MAAHLHSTDNNKVLIGDLNRTKRKENLNVLWFFNHYKIPYEDHDAKTQAAKNIIENEEWGTKFYRENAIDAWVKNYWKQNDEEIPEKTFFISFIDAEKMIRESSRLCKDPKEAALTLAVKNIDNPRVVTAEWEPYNDMLWKQNHNEDLEIGRNVNNLVFKLDPYFFQPWKEDYKSAKQNEFKVFKGYIKPHPDQASLTFDYKYLSNKYEYKDLYLVGRIISRPREVKDELKNRVIIQVAIPGRYLIEPWTGDGPGSHGGGGDMP